MNGLSADHFRFAANYIRTVGWQQGDIGEDGGPRCALGTIYSAITARGEDPDDWYGEHLVGLNDEVRQRVGWALYIWNDRPDRTATEVVALFEGLAFDEDLKAAAQSPIKASVVTLHTPEHHLGLAPAESRHDAIIPSLEAVGV